MRGNNGRPPRRLLGHADGLFFCKMAVVGWLSIGLTATWVFFPPQSRAAFLPSGTALKNLTASITEREQATRSIQRLLEYKIIHQRLTDLGLSEIEIMSRLVQLSDEQIHQLATHLDALIPGGNGLEAVALVLIIVILVVVLLQVTGHKVIITK